MTAPKPLPENYRRLTWPEKFYALQALTGFAEKDYFEKPEEKGTYQVIMETDGEPSIGWCVFNGRKWGLKDLYRSRAESKLNATWGPGIDFCWWRPADMAVPAAVRFEGES
jgi:hypothetical protein